MIDAHAVQDRGMKVMSSDWIFGNVIREFTTVPVGDSRLDAPARKPDRKATRVVVPAILLRCQFTLTVNGPTKLPPPNNQRLVKNPALLEIFQQGRLRLVNVLALQWKSRITLP